ncbi:hypothetical protein [Kitasatospora sp. NPDC094015]|uniref:hypothetical protein n=1 Tax=Kitasatospora sp. NPDC094015 TaxID=3155205 RepID=UPI00332BCA69
MVLREDSRTPRPVRRHGRPKPVGGRFRMPTLRFSGAAMAMSTVVGISLLTTWLLNEQQQVGRRPGLSVGASPPLPSPEAATPLAPPPAEPTAAVPAPALTGPPPSAATALPGARQSGASSSHAVTTRPGGTPSRPAAGSGDSEPPADRTSAPPAATPAPTGPAVEPTPATPTELAADHALRGTGEITSLGRSGTRHTLALAVGEPLTALQVELRLRRPDVLPGTAPWTDLPGAVATVSLDHDSLIYRFTLPPGLDVAPGAYGFTVTGSTVPAPTASPAPSGSGSPTAAGTGGARKVTVTVPAAEGWSASAFALVKPRAVAARGSFDAT